MTAPDSATPPDLQRRATLRLLLLACLVAAWSIHFWPHLHTANEAIRLYFAQAVVDTGSPVLDPICARHGSIPIDRSEYGGHILMDKAPGLSLLVVPIYALLQLLWPAIRRQDFWLLGYISTLLTVLLPVAAGLWSMRTWQRRIGVSERAASLTVLLTLLASPLFLYATLLFGHGLAAGLCALGFFGLAGAQDDAPSLRRKAWAGLAAGYAGLVDTPVFLLAAMLCLYALFRESGRPLQRIRGALPFIAGVALASLAQLGYNAWVLGHPLRFTYQFKGDAALAAIHDTGLLGFNLPSVTALWGLWFGAARGIFYHAPWLLAAALGLIHAGFVGWEGDHQGRDSGGRARRDARWLGGIVIAYALIVAGFVDWKAGDAAGARHLQPVVPLLAAGLGFALPIGRFASRRAMRSLLRAALAAGCAIGVLMHLPTVAGFPYHFDRIDYPVFELSWPVVTVFGRYSVSLGSLLGMPGKLSFAVQAALLAGCFVLWSRWTGHATGDSDDVEGDDSAAAPNEGASPGDPDLGFGRTLGLTLTLLLLWLAAAVAPIGRPRRAVQAARYQSTALLAGGLATRARFAADPEGRVERAMPSRKPRLTARERKELELRRREDRREHRRSYDAAMQASGSAPRRKSAVPVQPARLTPPASATAAP